MTEHEFKTKILSWVLKKSTIKIEDKDIQFDTLLLKEGIISSLQVMDLILFLQSISDNNISVDQLNSESFKSINHICSEFWKAQ